MTETIIVIIVVLVIALAIHNRGKRTGSRKAYHVGRVHGRRRRG